MEGILKKVHLEGVFKFGPFAASKEKDEFAERKQKIVEDIHAVVKQIDTVTTYFDYETNDDMLDSHIYNLKALHAKYSYLIKEAKEYGITVGA
ncbi:MAG: DUF2508 family protein [Oscillospiraceae bacterium]